MYHLCLSDGGITSMRSVESDSLSAENVSSAGKYVVIDGMRE